MSKQIIIYYSPFCPYCTMAFRLLKQLAHPYKSINLLTQPEKRPEMERLSQRTSVPQIFYQDVHIGGYDDLFALHQEGRLTELLR